MGAGIPSSGNNPIVFINGVHLLRSRPPGDFIVSN